MSEETETIKVTQEEINAVPSGDPAEWETSLRELCQEIERMPASEQQTAISVKASTIYQSVAEFNRYCESLFVVQMLEKLWNEKAMSEKRGLAETQGETR